MSSKILDMILIIKAAAYGNMSDKVLIFYAVDNRPTSAPDATIMLSNSPAQAPAVWIDLSRKDPLRLNNAPYPQIGISAETLRPLDHLRRIFHQMCKPWDKLSHTFIDTYLDHLLAELDLDRKNLEERTRPFAGLFQSDDWIFSAPRPLPRAYLPVRQNPSDTSQEDYVQVDFAFWLGTHFVAALCKETGLSPAKARLRHAQLTEAGIEIVPYGQAELRNTAVLFNQILSGSSAQFWNAQEIPSGPFPARLDDKL